MGSPLAVEYEATCARLGIEIVAAVKNRPVKEYLSNCRRIILPEEVTGELASVPFVTPLFTPANRKVAVAEAVTIGLSAAPPCWIRLRSSLHRSLRCRNLRQRVGDDWCLRQIGTHVVLNRSASLGHHTCD